MTLRKKILFYSLLTLLTLAVLEGMARLAYYFAFAEGYQISVATPTLSPTAEPDPTALAGLARQEAEFQNKVSSHPYYGFTFFSPNSPLNTMPPQQTRPGAVLVGLLGGSLAWETAPYLQQALTRHFADQGLAKEPVVIPLALGSMKQPQQLNIATFMLTMGGSFDLIVNLDGYNELADSYENFNRAVFPFFPRGWEKLVYLTRDEIALAGQIRATRNQLAELRQSAAASPFRYTALYGLLNRYQAEQAESRILQLNYQLSTQGSARSIEQQGPLSPFSDSSEMHQEAVRVWYRSSVLLSELAVATSADYYHFLQPNQYIPDAKPLSPEELQNYYRPDLVGLTDYAQNYPLYAQFGQELQQRGINYFDLAQIFNDHPETLYRDDCCHLNQRGYELLAAAMIEPMTPALQRRAAAPDPEPAGILAVAAPLPLPPAPPTPLPTPTPLAAPVTAPDFQVNLRSGNLLVYTKENCRPEHTNLSFFLHITPVNVADLPPERRRYGFDSQDFPFQNGGRTDNPWGGQDCVIERTLPDYPIAALRTGQHNAAGEVWSVELSLP